MGGEQVTITLPMSAHGFGVLITVLAVALLSIVIFWMTGKGEPKDWFTAIREKMGLAGLHPVLVIFLSLAWAALFLTLLTGVFWVLFAIGEKVSVSSEEEGGDLRWYLLTLTAVTAALGAVISLPFTLIKTALNRRQTETSEQGLITDRINKAVEGLGAEKVVSRMGRTITFNTETKGLECEHEVMEFQDSPYIAERYDMAGAPIFGPWTNFETTQPNLEVRIGAIYALERISQDSARDHIQIMEILCAYIRQNAGRENVPLPKGDPTPEDWKAWGRKGRAHPRLDVDVALKVIERRDENRKQLERYNGYCLGLERLSLCKTNFSQRDLTAADLQYAALHGTYLALTQLQGADLKFAKLLGSNLSSAKLQGANLFAANLKGADLMGAELQGAKLLIAKLQGANLMGAELQGAGLRGTRLQGANLEGANLQGADLRDAQLDECTNLTEAILRDAAMSSVDFTNVPQMSNNLPETFGDASVTLPGGHGPEHESWPAHWPKFALYDQFETEWRKWQADPDNYTPPNPPKADT